MPLISAIAAGNCAAVKPSRYSEKTSAVMEDMIKAFFPAEYISVFQGGSEVNKQLLEIKFDYIFFTGSPAVGRVVMEAAAKNLTPVTLELGGKSPCIVDETAKTELAAKRIAWGKTINAGQTCVAPDYVMVQEDIYDEFIEYLKKYFVMFYGEKPLENPEFSKIINQKHFNRLNELIKNSKVLYGGKSDILKNKIEPTVISCEPALTEAVMQEEIFGPLLPVVKFKKIDDAIDTVGKFPKPLALYLFTRRKENENKILNKISFGGGCINDTLIHLSNTNLPFGGVGESGMGSYHGKNGFNTFSHYKSILKKSNYPDIAFRYPPYKNKIDIIKKLLK
jgi:aldehyde dehydrogenase (NAD+)